MHVVQKPAPEKVTDLWRRFPKHAMGISIWISDDTLPTITVDDCMYRLVWVLLYRARGVQ